MTLGQGEVCLLHFLWLGHLWLKNNSNIYRLEPPWKCTSSPADILGSLFSRALGSEGWPDGGGCWTSQVMLTWLPMSLQPVCPPTCSGLSFSFLLFNPQETQFWKSKRCTREGGSEGSWHSGFSFDPPGNCSLTQKIKLEGLSGSLKHTPTRALKKQTGFWACSESLLSRVWSGRRALTVPWHSQLTPEPLGSIPGVTQPGCLKTTLG